MPQQGWFKIRAWIGYYIELFRVAVITYSVH